MRLPARIVVGTEADTLRRTLGPTAWAALEVLVARSTPDDDAYTVAASVREVASTLGLSKNAAHRAIRRLVDAGLIAPAQHRAADGRFLTGTYRLTIPTEALRAEPGPALAAESHPAPRPHTQRRRRSVDLGVQLDLLSDAG